MERRVSERQCVNVNVYVSQPGRAALCCTASDISNDGIFLKTNPLFVSRRKKLDLVFALTIKSSNVVRMRHVPAVVARTESDGIGVVFCKEKSERRTAKGS